jgi:hypothetical protein
MNDLGSPNPMPQRNQTDRQPHDRSQADDSLGPSYAIGKRRGVGDKGRAHRGVMAPLPDQEIGLDLLPAEPLPQRWTNDEQFDQCLH